MHRDSEVWVGRLGGREIRSGSRDGCERGLRRLAGRGALLVVEVSPELVGVSEAASMLALGPSADRDLRGTRCLPRTGRLARVRKGVAPRGRRGVRPGPRAAPPAQDRPVTERILVPDPPRPGRLRQRRLHRDAARTAVRSTAVRGGPRAGEGARAAPAPRRGARRRRELAAPARAGDGARLRGPGRPAGRVRHGPRRGVHRRMGEPVVRGDHRDRRGPAREVPQPRRVLAPRAGCRGPRRVPRARDPAGSSEPSPRTPTATSTCSATAAS